MITTPDEFREAKALLLREIDWRTSRGDNPPSSVQIGAMIETPAFANSFNSLAGKVDFLSVGSNDLHQYYFPASRNNRRVADRYSVLTPGFLKLLKSIRQNADEMNVPISVCGEAAGHPIEALALLLLGYRHFSMQAGSIGPARTSSRNCIFRA